MKGLLGVACSYWRKRKAAHWSDPASTTSQAVEQIGVLPGEPHPATGTDLDTDAEIRRLFERMARTPGME
jgi:hypothetical protein